MYQASPAISYKVILKRNFIHLDNPDSLFLPLKALISIYAPFSVSYVTEFCRHRLWTLWFGGEKNWIGDCKKSPAWCMLMVHKKLWLPTIPQVLFIVTRMKFGELYLLVFPVFWKTTAPKKPWLLETVQFVAGFSGNSLLSTDSRSGNASHNHFRFK